MSTAANSVDLLALLAWTQKENGGYLPEATDFAKLRMPNAARRSAEIRRNLVMMAKAIESDRIEHLTASSRHPPDGINLKDSLGRSVYPVNETVDLVELDPYQQRLIDAGNLWVEVKDGRLPVEADFTFDNGFELEKVIEHFGSTERFLRTLGFPLERVYEWTPSLVVTAAEHFAMRNNRLPQLKDFDRNANLPSLRDLAALNDRVPYTALVVAEDSALAPGRVVAEAVSKGLDAGRSALGGGL